jgi:hypothetical protein
MTRTVLITSCTHKEHGMADATIHIRLTDLHKVKQLLAETRERLAQTEKERDEWEARYWALLEQHGGTT